MQKDLMMKNKPLHTLDDKNMTYGCRHSNPDICSNNGIDTVCAFYRKDKMCNRPPKSWKKTYERLKTEKK